jgi:plasmid maintenance system killer protein
MKPYWLQASVMAIKSFKHKGLEDFFYDGTTKRINAKHKDKLETRLDRLERLPAHKICIYLITGFTHSREKWRDGGQWMYRARGGLPSNEV